MLAFDAGLNGRCVGMENQAQLKLAEATSGLEKATAEKREAETRAKEVVHLVVQFHHLGSTLGARPSQSGAVCGCGIRVEVMQDARWVRCVMEVWFWGGGEIRRVGREASEERGWKEMCEHADRGNGDDVR
eukprot:3611074-Rhodomonas_salina.1